MTVKPMIFIEKVKRRFAVRLRLGTGILLTSTSLSKLGTTGHGSLPASAAHHRKPWGFVIEVVASSSSYGAVHLTQSILWRLREGRASRVCACRGRINDALLALALDMVVLRLWP